MDTESDKKQRATKSEQAGSDHEGLNPAEHTGATAKTREINGPKGPEPTRYGDWEVNGRCSDF